MGWLDDAWGGAKKGWNAVTGAGSDFLETFYDKPARDQKNAYQGIADRSRQFGGQQRDWYGDQGKAAQDQFGQTQADIDSLRGTDPTSRLRDEYAQAQENYNKPGSQQQFYTNMLYDPSYKPTEQQDFYKYLDGSKDQLTDTEQLYNERRTGGDPAAAYEDQRATDAINRQLAARGGYNSGAGGRQITDYYANVGAQRSHDLGTLAGAADAARLGKVNALGGAAQGASGEQTTYTTGLGNAAKGASQEQADWNTYKAGLAKDVGDQLEKHLNEIIGSDQNLAAKKADIQERFAQLGGQAMSDGEKEALAAELAKSGVDPAKIKSLLDLFGSGAKAVATVAAS